MGKLYGQKKLYKSIMIFMKTRIRISNFVLFFVLRVTGKDPEECVLNHRRKKL